MSLSNNSGVSSSGLSGYSGSVYQTGVSNILRETPMGKIIPSCVFDVDATIGASYSGGQIFANFVNTPADGSARSAYNFQLGASNTPSADDPTFVGSINDPKSFFQFDGGDIITLIGANPAFIRDLHKTTGGSDFWFAFVYRPIDDAGARRLLGTMTANNQNGFNLNSSTAELLALVQGNGTTQSSTNMATAPALTDTIVIGSRRASDGAYRYVVNSSVPVSTTATFNTTTTDAAATLRMAASVANGFRLYGVSMGNSFLSSDQFAAIVNQYNVRHQRRY